MRPTPSDFFAALFGATPWAQLVAVAIGGAIGAVARHMVTRLATLIPGGSSHWGTLTVNLVGCFAIGLLAGWVIAGATMGTHRQLALRTGFLGSLTTFSTFALESLELIHDRRPWWAVAYLVANVACGLLAVMLGIWIGRSVGSSS